MTDASRPNPSESERRSLKSAFRFLNRSDGSLADKTIRSGVWVTLSNFLNRALRLARVMILARLLLPEHFGLMGILLFFTRALDVVSQPGVSAAIIQRKDHVEESVDVAWTVLVLRGIVLGALTFVAAPFVADFYDELALKNMTRVIASVFVIQGFTNSYLIILRKEMDFKRLTFFEAVTSVLELILVVVIAYRYRTVWALVAGQILRAILRVATSFVITSARPRFSLDGQLFRELFRYGKFVTGALVVTFFSTNIDSAVIGKVLGMGALGYYVLAHGLASLPTTQIAPVVTRVLFPAFSKLQGDLPALRRTYLGLLKLVATIAFPTVAGLAVLAPEVVRIFYGEQWLPMVGALLVLCLYAGIQSLTSTAEPVFNAIGKPYVTFYLVCLRLLFTLALVYPLTIRFDIVGTALAVTIPVCLEQFILWRLMSRSLACPVSEILKSMAVATFATGVMAACVHLLQPRFGALPDVVGLLCGVLVGVSVYAGLVALLDRQFIQDSRRQFARVFAGRS